jgi:polymorphic toxin system DSP-PTPase phosphatase-like protein
MMTDIDRPIPESYWVVPGYLLAGEYPGELDEEITRKRIDALIEAGFDLFIDLTKSNETWPYLNILLDEVKIYEVEATHLRFPIGDFGLPTSQQMNSILDTIDQNLLEGRKIYLHCWGGIGRTGTTVGCYLVRKGKTGEEALDQLSAWWRGVPKSRYHLHSPETLEQMEFIRTWAEHDRNSLSSGS